MERIGETNRPQVIPVNPLINKLWSVDAAGNNTATYQGIYKKCLFFLGMTVLGVLLSVFFGSTGAITVEPETGELFVDKIVILLLLIAAGIFVIFPFIAFLVRVTIPVTGTLYCVSVGFLFSFFATLDDELGSYIMLALILTLTVVGVMGFLFVKGIIRVTLKMRAVTTTMFITVVIGSLLMFLCSFVPIIGDCIMQLLANPVIAAAASIGGLIIAILFLLVDFDNIRMIVEDELPKKYEWFASFGLVFTIVWIYLKVLHLILQATNNK